MHTFKLLIAQRTGCRALMGGLSAASHRPSVIEPDQFFRQRFDC
jgi:hypothetical protein